MKRRKNFNQRLLNSLRDNQAILSKKRKIANYIVENNFSPNIMKKKINILKKNGVSENSITLLHCTSEYPAPLDSINLKAMVTLRKKFKCRVNSSSTSPDSNNQKHWN